MTSDVPAFDMDDLLLERLKLCTNLPSPPVVVSKIIELTEDPDTTLGDVADALRVDPALASKILRMANSPLYARRRNTESVRDAVSMFGMTGTLTLAMSFSLVESLSEGSSNGLRAEDYAHYWSRSLAAATACRAIAIRLGLRPAEDYFLAGLLQDIGMLALDRAVPGIYQNIRLSAVSHEELRAAETCGGGGDHAQVGAWMLTNWKLPPKLVRAVRGSHGPTERDSDADDTNLSRAVALSSILAEIWFGADSAAASRKASEIAHRYFELDRVSLAQILEPIATELQQNAVMFEVDLGDAAVVQFLTEQARDALMLRNLSAMTEARDLRQPVRTLKVQSDEREQESLMDSLTGLYNRRYLNRALHNAFEAAIKKDGTVAVAYLDLDHFKSINDIHGHTTGDEVLKKTASVLKESSRRGDVVARFGGEEFVILCPDAGVEDVQALSTRLLRTLQRTHHSVPCGDVIIVTASVGIAVHRKGARFGTPEQLLDAADRALYEAKEGGRNRYALAA